MTSHPTTLSIPLRFPHPLPIPPPLLFCRLRSIEAPCRPSPIGARLHFMADCEACVSPSSALVPPPNLQRFPTCSLHWRSCQRLLPPSLTCCRWRTRRRVRWQNKTSLQTAVMRDMPFRIELLGDVNHPDHSPFRFVHTQPSLTLSTGRPRASPRIQIHQSNRFNLGREVKHSSGEELPGMCQVLVHLALVEALHSLRRKAEIGGTHNAPWATRQWSYAHKLWQKQDGI